MAIFFAIFLLFLDRDHILSSIFFLLIFRQLDQFNGRDLNV